QLNVLIELLKNPTYKGFFEAEKYPIKFFFDILRMLTLDIKISYVGDYIDGLQVMGVLESRAIEFENVIITSFNDDIYPGNSANNNSFIPFHLRKGFGLPTFERKDAIYSYNFYRLIARAKRVYFISNNQADDNQSNEPSRFLYQLKYQYRWQIEQKQVVSNAQAEQSIQNIAKNEQTLERLNELAQKGISATFLNDYIRCQFYFYWKHIQQVAEQKQDEEIFDHARIGTIFHNVMRLLYEPYINQKVDSKMVEKLQESVDDIMQKEEILPKNSHKLTNLEKNIIQEMVQKMLKNDQQNDNFTILQLENRFEKKHPFNGKDVLLKGFIDRIDMIDDLENNQTIIRLIDYKTGKAEKDIKSLDEICEDEKYKYILQTLFYCLLYEPANADFICEPHLFSVRENKKKQNETTNLILGESKNKQNIQFTPAIRDEFLQQLDRLLSEIFDQNQPFKSTDKMFDDFGSPCNSCAYWQLCKNSATAKKADL
ncbi:MAG: PD-(D/E)XK nuclease family protein, partial [Paludibacteraceae bacterium]|nr:PD-(D/E)XK nuclease family protein [Paludibacteraceae bacterium]